MSIDRRSLLAATFSGVLCTDRMKAQNATSAVPKPDATGGPIEAPAPGFYPYSGISGPGLPATAASEHGGWHSGSAGLSYSGANPPPFKTNPWNDYAKGTAVTAGLIPQIRPLIEAHVRDTVICLAGDGNYYMTGSTGDNIWAFNDGVELWRSPDLKKWDYLGLVWSVAKDGTWEKKWRALHNLPSRAVWAPEIHFVRGNFVICLSMAPGGLAILKSVSGKPEGPYVHAFSADQPIANGIDATLFEDDDGSVYFTYAGAQRIVRLKNDLSGFDGVWHTMTIDQDHDPAHHGPRCANNHFSDLGREGAVLFKAEGRYYLGAADWPQGRYSTMLAISDNVLGPWRLRHESVPCGGGTGFFRDKKGGWWSAYFGNDDQSPFLEKPAIVKLSFDAEGRVGVDKAFYKMAS